MWSFAGGVTNAVVLRHVGHPGGMCGKHVAIVRSSRKRTSMLWLESNTAMRCSCQHPEGQFPHLSSKLADVAKAERTWESLRLCCTSPRSVEQEITTETTSRCI